MDNYVSVVVVKFILIMNFVSFFVFYMGFNILFMYNNF